MTQRVITASRLEDGAVVWYGGGARWVTALDDAVASDNAATVAAWLDAAKRLEEAGALISAYQVEVEPASGTAGRRLTPIRLRERIRAGGPTVTAA